MKKYIFIFIGVMMMLPAVVSASDITTRLKGSILLQVEAHGEAWYVNPADGLRYYMKDGSVAYQMMRNFGLGITDTDLAKIPSVTTTSDMKVAASVCASNATANRLKGKILLQVQQHGEAWYIYPKTCRSIYLKDGESAYEVMRFLGLGITNEDLALIASNSGVITKTDDWVYHEKRIGEEATLTTIKLKINAYTEDWSISGSKGSIFAKPDKKFIIVNLGITNFSNYSVVFTPDDFVLVESVGGLLNPGSVNKYSPYSDDNNTLNNNLSSATIESNTQKTGILVYEVPKDSNNFSIAMRKSGTNEIFIFYINKAGQLCNDNPQWTDNECSKIANHETWVGMTYEMLIKSLGVPDSKRISNYGSGDEYQYCYINKTPTCFYDDNNDDKIDSYN